MTTRTLRRRLVRFVAVGVVLAVLLAAPVAAGHGSWNHHHLHWWEQGPSDYGSYADVGATQNYDFGHATWQRWTTGWSFIESESVTCEGAEACSYRKTYTQYFPQSSYIIRSLACAKDGSHELSGAWLAFLSCTMMELKTHRHTATTN